jgi:HD superfamily phosphodiesterase
MDSQQIQKVLLEVEQAVAAMFAQYTPVYLVYHNINHTRSVVAHTIEIAANYDLNEEDRFVLLAAAWFHDTGQIFTTPEWHEEESVRVANIFFYEQASVPINLITAIDHCILATKMPQRPHTLIEEILCDADLYHLGTEAFMTIDKLVKEESKLRGLPVDTWDQGTIKLMLAHHFHTTYCREKLTPGKEKNLLLLKRSQE